ncbi:PadR family transcriptional regulator [Paenibacillus aurantius]|uniref:PadR family transcriptional regulator n=1 Tax=Paenibacillus aurantius TaxID=2918900 RepID=A0AA96RFN8_9BACL|nr:PadR family transcriptional regulator [Paenibacillus aurantius]WNQ11443.1 PadR family transcriptional regulator [Paenibacillus aurantius]
MSNVECIVLGLLQEGFRYGHEIDQIIEQRQFRFWANITRVSIYKALKRMEQKGWVHTAVEKEGNMPERTVYSLTDEGRDAYREMIKEGLASPELVKFDYSVPLGGLFVLSPEESIQQITKRKQMVEKTLKNLPPEEADGDPRAYLGRRANIRLLRKHYEMEREWLEWLTDELKKAEGE